VKALVADDLNMINEQLPEMVGKYVHTEIVGPPGNETATLKTQRIRKPVPVIFDIKMSALSGLKFLRESRKEDKMIKVFLLTFNSSDNFRKLTLQTGTDNLHNVLDDFKRLTLVFAEMGLRN